MFSSESDQDENNIFDQLRSIRPFTVDQLYLLHPDVGCPPKTAITSEKSGTDGESGAPLSDKDVYQNLVEHERLRNRLADLKHDIKKLYKKTHDNVDKAWSLRDESIRKIAMCQQGKIAETTFKFKQAHIDEKQLDMFFQEFGELIDLITKDYIYYSFESQMRQNNIATKLAISYQTPELELRKARLKSAITTLMEFMKYLGDVKSNFVVQCRKWLRALCKKYLEDGSTDEYRFIVSQLAMGPASTADWSADLIECKPYEQVSGFDSVPQYITHCSTLLSELFYGIQLRIKNISATMSVIAPAKCDETSSEIASIHSDQQDTNWSLIDPRFSCTEELDISANSSNLLSETDVIKFCLKIPVTQIFRAYVKKCLDKSDEFGLETDKNYEFIMLKLLTIGTIVIKTYQTGLETFNSIQYGSLIEYLSSQIRRTVIILSDQWSEFKQRLRGIDDALLMRLQVEYDNFMLRSISVILELRQCGIWRHLSRIERDSDALHIDEHPLGWSTDSLRPAFAKLLQVTGITASQPQASATPTSPKRPRDLPSGSSQKRANATSRGSSSSLTYEFSIEWFKDVSEPMLWHILWQFYHNAFVSSCDYHSDNYWLEKFQEKSVVYLFVNKMKDSPPGECSYLLNSITSMLLSRTRPDSKLVQFIATEIFNLTFEHKSLRSKIARHGIKSLVRCAEKFPDLISHYISLMSSEKLDGDAVDLVRGCSLTGWLCNDDELSILENWLIDYPLDAAQNKIARLIVSRLLLNSPDARPAPSAPPSASQQPSNEIKPFQKASRRRVSRRLSRQSQCFVDLSLRRKLALILYHASVHHLPEPNQFGSQSLGASVEIAFGASMLCEPDERTRNDLLDLSTESNYQQFYIWTWRILFALRLHILNQPETDWNDVKVRSGTSRSTKNTVLANDSFHPVPSINDAECAALQKGVESHNVIASFIHLFLTDITWQSDSVELCLEHLNVLVNSGHLTPSLMAMKFFTICHLDDLSSSIARDKKCVDYFTSIILSDFDATRLASLIMTQLDRLKQFRQIQLSQFYINVLLDVNAAVNKQNSSSWFSSNELSLEKIACLLDYIVRFNFATQRIEIIRKFYDSAYVIQGQQTASGGGGGGWLSSFLASSNSTGQRDFLTNLHVLAQKFKKYTWLQWVITECDTLRLEKIWEDIVAYLSGNEEANLDLALKKVCPQINASLLKSTLPIYAWITQIFDIMETDLNHPLCPLIWYNFFLSYFANSLNGVSVGVKLVSQETLARLLTRLDSLFNYHTYKQRNWSSTSVMQQKSLTKLYRAYKLWLQDQALQDAYVDMDRLRDEYLVPLLNAVMESSNANDCLQYVDLDSIETQNKNLIQVWTASTRLTLEGPLGGLANGDPIMYLDQNESVQDEPARDTSMDDEVADDAVSVIASSMNSPSGAGKSALTGASNKSPDAGAYEELSKPLSDDHFGQQKYQTTEELMDTVKRHFRHVFDESTQFRLNISELERTRSEIVELVRQLYTNKRREFVRVVPCIEGHECAGPARIKVDVDEALMDERKSQCIQDRRRQCQELAAELLTMPKSRCVQATSLIEDYIRRLLSDPTRAETVIETLLGWLSEPINYKQLNGSYYAANHLLKTVLEILSTTDRADAYNSSLIKVCLAHPGSVQIFSPHLSPSACSAKCFLSLYETICSQQVSLGPMATFVVLSKFDLASWLATNSTGKDKSGYHKLIVTTCSAFKDIGKSPDSQCDLALDLFKRHLQVELAPPDRRKPEELALVLNEFLNLMSQQVLPPMLWLNFLSILGLERTTTASASSGNRARPRLNKSLSMSSTPMSLSSSVGAGSVSPFPLATLRTTLYQEAAAESSATIDIADDVIRLAECQAVFDYHALSEIIKTVGNFMRQQHESTSVTLLELYEDYLEQYAVLMLTVTFMWLKSTSDAYPDNHELIWKQFMSIWYDWVFLTKNCQNVGKSSYSLVVNYFVVSLGYMIRKIPDSTQLILKSLLTELTKYIAETREIVYLELTILQRSLKHLPWSSLLVSPSDINNLASLSEQENYNVSDLVSHIMLHLNTKDSLASIRHNDKSADKSILAHAVERLATTIILQSADLKGYRLCGSYLPLIPVDEIPRLATLVLGRMELANLEHSQNNKLLVNLLRFICIKLDSGDLGDTLAKSAEQRTSDTFRRCLAYAHFVSSYMIDLIKRHPKVTSTNRAYLNAVLDNSLRDLKPLVLSSDYDLKQKTSLYRSLFECCSCELLDAESRSILAMSVVHSSLLKDRPIVVLEILHAVGQILRDSRILVLMVDTLVDLYLKMNGHYERVSKSFWLASLASDTYLNTCIELRAPLALVVFFESLACGRQPPSAMEACEVARAAESAPQAPSAAAASGALDVRQIWPSFLHWMALLAQAMGGRSAADQQRLADNSGKLIAAWLRLLTMLESNFKSFLLDDQLISISPPAQAVSEATTTKTTTTALVAAAAAASSSPLLSARVGSDASDDNTSQDGGGGAASGGSDDGKSKAASAKPAALRAVGSKRAAVASEHKSLLSLIKQLIALYDSVNSGGLWSYLKSSSKSEQSIKISVTSLGIACFLADRALQHINGGHGRNSTSSGGGGGDDDVASPDSHQVLMPSLSASPPAHLAALRDELAKSRRAALSKLEAARKSKSFLECAQFIDSLIESVQQNNKVQYGEVVQLITTFSRAALLGSRSGQSMTP